MTAFILWSYNQNAYPSIDSFINFYNHLTFAR